MATVRSAVDIIQDSIDQFVKGLPSMQKDLFARVYAILKDLSLDADGKILPTIGNMKLITKINRELESISSDSSYLDKVSSLEDSLTEITVAQTAYFSSSFNDFSPIKAIPEIKKQTFNGLVDQLTDAGINDNVVGHAVDIVHDGITNGSSLYDLTEQLKTSLLGDDQVDGKMMSYAKQTINDTLSGYSRTYNKLVTNDLGLQWYKYVGALVDHSRPICIALVDKEWVHESELGGIAHGTVDGRKVSTAGMMPGTTADNFQDRCGGYNCNHQLVPVSPEFVPSKIRRKFEPDTPPDQDEITDERPNRK